MPTISKLRFVPGSGREQKANTHTHRTRYILMHAERVCKHMQTHVAYNKASNGQGSLNMHCTELNGIDRFAKAARQMGTVMKVLSYQTRTGVHVHSWVQHPINANSG